ncbi:MAG: carboxypeptidase regulatory-like domain-containing protein [Rhodothermales bacterium]
MRSIFVLIILLHILPFSAPISVSAQQAPASLDTRYTFTIAPTSLIEALGLLRAQTNARFTYSPSSLPNNQLVQVDAKDQTLPDILDALFTPLAIEYEYIGNQIALRWIPPAQRVAFTQTIRGRVVDQDSHSPLIGANIVVASLNPIRGASTDIEGYFEIPGVPIGRQSLTVQYIGFETAHIRELLLTAGKEIVLDIELAASAISMEMVVVAEELDLIVPLNESAIVSARSFSVEHTQRFAASLSDPARMAQSFAGVSRSEDDLLNEVIVRGHSPKYTVWRVEGIEIPNPNHFGDDGHSSGGVNMLSANMLTNSDFLSGAFPAEYGNAIAGVFDINLRKGNTARPEYTIGFGALGLEGTIEGPFSKKYNGSYLVNYRYSTLGLMTYLDLVKEDVIAYQDLAFKFHLPTRRAGVFSLFGIAGDSFAEELANDDSCNCPDPILFDPEDDDEFERKAIVGLSHRIVLSNKTFLKSVVAAFGKEEREGIYLYKPELSETRIYVDEERSMEKGIRGHLSLNHKFNLRHLLKVGIEGSLLSVDYGFRNRFNNPQGNWVDEINSQRNLGILRGFGQWTYRYNDKWTILAGFHAVHFNLTDETSVEPRLGIKWQASEDKQFSLGSSLHSQIEPFGVYLLSARSYANAGAANRLRLSKSWHNVLGFEKRFKNQIRLKTELYFDYGYNLPVDASAGSSFSVINTYFLYAVYLQSNGLKSTGTSTNYGLDVSFEKIFSNGYYFMLNGSLFDTNFTANNNTKYPGRYNTRYMTNLVTGIEFKLGNKQKDRLGLNTRIVFGGGNRYTPINVADVAKPGFVFDPATTFAAQLAPYFRVDLGINYTMNKSYLTHSVYLDIQNIIHRRNEGFIEYDFRNQTSEIDPQLGILPIMGYRLTF